VENLDVEQRLRVRADVVDERLHEVLRLAARRADEDPIAAPDVAEDPLLGMNLSGVPVLESIEVVRGCSGMIAPGGKAGRRR